MKRRDLFSAGLYFRFPDSPAPHPNSEAAQKEEKEPHESMQGDTTYQDDAGAQDVQKHARVRGSYNIIKLPFPEIRNFVCSPSLYPSLCYNSVVARG